MGGAQRSGEALGDVLLMGVRLYSPALGRFLQVDPQSDGNASAYDYCNGDAVNCTDLDGNWGWKKFFSRVAKVAEYASWIPGPVGAFSAAVSAGAYAAAGNRAKAFEMGLTAAAGLVGGGAGVRAGFKAAKVSSKFGRRTFTAGRKAKRALCACTRRSFTPDTPVVMADGSTKPIADIVVGDVVLSVDPESGELVGEPVLGVIVGSGGKRLIDLTVDDGSLLGGLLTATDVHPIWIKGKGWIEAGEVAAGDLMRDAAGGLIAVRAVHDRGWLSQQTVYNLTVADTHTYYVRAGTADLLVHNTSPCLTKDAWEHILERHVHRAHHPRTSKFHTRNPAKVRRMIDRAIRENQREGENYVLDLGREIGRHPTFGPQTRIRVVVRNGYIKTAHPY